MLCCCFSLLLLKVLFSYMSPVLFVCLKHLQTSSFPSCHLHLPSLSRHCLSSCLRFRNLPQKIGRTLLMWPAVLWFKLMNFIHTFFSPSHPGFNSFLAFLCKSWNRFFSSISFQWGTFWSWTITMNDYSINISIIIWSYHLILYMFGDVHVPIPAWCHEVVCSSLRGHPGLTQKGFMRADKSVVMLCLQGFLWE